MSTRIRLRRMGAAKRPFYRVVVADQRSPRNGRFIEAIGKYHPLEDPSLIEIDEERALHWLRVGAQPSDQVRILMTRTGIWQKFTTERPSAALVAPKYERVTKEKVSKKAASKAKQEVEATAGTDGPAHPAAGAGAPVAEEPEGSGGTGTAEGTRSEPPSAVDASGDEPVEA
jgi:small subunit ribosomal protein S16